ncbi:MAG: hypothetical protein UX09_C0046G0002 [Candidatus Uhrbacteria bacterium GW2011_GWE2_45_35]|uniref:Uncharacterized protein n=2 Tax=Candidatus Uhriibacteriota TaxID=1752732 RepID=A0A0G1JFW2_9BACT|nr:MAG: hypothetical protein UW63_C0032G0009 [Candidatus Uhrbacteria bacterium GW2011_GWF2_44_350]KKU06640.1 MAG: hypothetical protein UX09_C0046G0002 [Candidatus Uhrbacteria bacterium GW2011_GWE2_45_35]HBR80712.1 hypothetical protein [Candidatus Uhrbacteria bacterium]HCU31674.1 hypothetical protein [Candidatus Uhrbacteria bacterium]
MSGECPTPSVDQLNDREKNKELASRWSDRLDKASDALLAKENFTLDELFGLALRSVFDRIDPADPEEFAARKVLSKDVEKDADKNPDVYFRILVANLNLEQAVKENWSMTASTLLAPASRLISQAIFKPDWFKDNFNNDILSLYKAFDKFVLSKAEDVGVKIKYLPQAGDRVTWRGRRVEIGRFSFDGTIALKVDYQTDRALSSEGFFSSEVPAQEILLAFDSERRSFEGKNFVVETSGGNAARSFIDQIKILLDKEDIPYKNKDFQKLRQEFFQVIRGRSAKEKIKIKIVWSGDGFNIEEV